MPGSKKGHSQGNWNELDLKRAVMAVTVNKMSQKKAATTYNIPRETLRRHLKKLVSHPDQGVAKELGRKPLLTANQELELSNMLQDMEARMYGLSSSDVRSLVFSFCQKNNIITPFKVETELAGKGWFQRFMGRHPELSLRVPEPTSIQRVIGFNQAKSKKFFETLGGILFDSDGNRKIPPENMYNVDESGFSICHKPRQVVAKKGRRSVSALTSAEKGKTVTTVCCMSAAGHYIPPLFIFPRVRMKESLLDNAPPGSIARPNKSGWITTEIFTAWFDHFLNVVQPQAKLQPVLLLADGHSSHTRNIDVIEKARTNNVIILILPSHCTHKLQPCDVSLFKSLNAHYDDGCSVWLRNHPGRAIKEDDICGIFTEAYGKAATVANAIKGFQHSGIHPFKPNRFTQDDFVAAEVTDRPDPSAGAAASITGSFSNLM